jgi:aryl-alcohol dehydrogenase-like predicted oxidoreductase
MDHATRPLGRTGMEITLVGAGSWAIGGGNWKYGWGPQDDATSMRALRRALDGGVNWIDTAPVYGLGHAETIVGRVVREMAATDRPLLFTKCGLRWSDADPFGEPVKNLRPESVRIECEASLRRLGVERLDLLQFHWPDAVGTAVEDSWGEMSRLVDDGKIRAGGVSNFDVTLLERCERIMHVGSLQPPFSLVLRSEAADVIPWCREHGTGVIVYSPLQAGLMTDSFAPERIELMAERDWRRWNSEEFQEPRLSRNLALRDALRPIAERHASTVAAVALAWVTSWPGISGAIVGSRSADQVDAWIPAIDLTLSAADLDEIAAAIERTGAGSGPARAALPATAG